MWESTLQSTIRKCFSKLSRNCLSSNLCYFYLHLQRPPCIGFILAFLTCWLYSAPSGHICSSYAYYKLDLPGPALSGPERPRTRKVASPGKVKASLWAVGMPGAGAPSPAAGPMLGLPGSAYSGQSLQLVPGPLLPGILPDRHWGSAPHPI